ncbi:10189_t:CDS:2, partial [Racocetra fulgida]
HLWSYALYSPETLLGQAPELKEKGLVNVKIDRDNILSPGLTINIQIKILINRDNLKQLKNLLPPINTSQSSPRARKLPKDHLPDSLKYQNYNSDVIRPAAIFVKAIIASDHDLSNKKKFP